MAAGLRMLMFLGLMTTVSAAPVPKEKRYPPDPERIQGEWQIVVSEHDGKPYTKAVWKFEGTKMFSRDENAAADQSSSWEITLDVSKDPKEIMIGGYPGIYTFEGDTLKICYRLGDPRPTKFDSTSTASSYYNILKRVPAKK
jgi:uncharacterized protein (TIGR03067 family)